MNKNQEPKKLAQANRQIAQLKQQISHQLKVIQRLPPKGKSRVRAAAMLSTLEEALRAVVEHRELILQRLESGRTPNRHQSREGLS
jgi:hypothetical protein